MLREEIAARLKAIREWCGYKQEDIAKYLNVTPQKVSSMETGRTRVDAETLARLCELYNVDANYVLGLCLTDSNADDIFHALHQRPEIMNLLKSVTEISKEDVEKIIKISMVFSGK